MTELSAEAVFRDNEARPPNSVTSLSLARKALYNLPCLSDFKNLDKLDLTFNSLTSLKGLEWCSNLKWLSVQQNKLQSLNGIERLVNLNVLNAGKNKLRSMDEVKNLVKLRALILNDNEIASISGLNQLMELNTLVLSRNPIRKVGKSLATLKSIAKISLSGCQLEDIDSSIKACTGLEQLRLAHNDIKTLPVELAFSKKLQILDLGNNMFSRWSDLEVLSSLHNLRNLNLLGNPIAEKVKLVKKIKKLVPHLHILNSKRMDKWSSEKDQKVEDAVGSVGNEFKPLQEKIRGYDAKHKETSPKNTMIDDFDKRVNQLGLKGDDEVAKDSGLDVNKSCDQGYQLGEKRDHMKKQKISRKSVKDQVSAGQPDEVVTQNDGDDEQNKQKKKREKHAEEVDAYQSVKDKRSNRKVEKAYLDVIDDKETSFVELVAYDTTVSMKPIDGQRSDSQAIGKFDSVSALVTYPAKKKKRKTQVSGASVLQFLTPEVGLGGPSAWINDEE